MKNFIIKLLLKLYAPIINSLDQSTEKLESRFEELSKKVDHLQVQQEKVKDIARSNHDRTDYLTKGLYQLRKTPSYKEAFEKNPLVSVRIATYNRPDELINKAIKSVLKQTYQNFEIVVVGDHCTDDTEERINAIKDRRVRFYNLPNRINYPEDRVKKWRVIGTPAINMASHLAKGHWIAALDDDDEFTPNHLEKLVEHALKTKCELVYGASMRKNLSTGKEEHIWSFPPERGQFTFHSAIYMKELDKIFKYDFKSWVMEEVADWNMCRRMMESGVKISAIEDVVGIIYHVPINNPKKDY